MHPSSLVGVLDQYLVILRVSAVRDPPTIRFIQITVVLLPKVNIWKFLLYLNYYLNSIATFLTFNQLTYLFHIHLHCINKFMSGFWSVYIYISAYIYIYILALFSALFRLLNAFTLIFVTSIIFKECLLHSSILPRTGALLLLFIF